MGYKVIALDIDGTIRDADNPISERLKAAVARAKDLGATVTLATGRSLVSALEFARELGIDDPIVNSQGALVSNPLNGAALWRRHMNERMVAMTLEALADHQVEIMMFLEGGVLVNEITPWMARYSARTGARVTDVGDLRKAVSQEPIRVVAVGDEEIIPAVHDGLKERLDSRLYVTKSLPMFCEILHPEGGKARALSWLCRSAGVGLEQAIVFGNGPDDVEMVKAAGKGVAMEGSPEELLKVADVIAPPVREGGAADVLEGLLDRGLIA